MKRFSTDNLPRTANDAERMLQRANNSLGSRFAQSDFNNWTDIQAAWDAQALIDSVRADVLRTEE